VKIRSSCTHPHVAPNLYAFLSSAEMKDVLKNVRKQIVDGPHWLLFFYILWKSMGSINHIHTETIKQPSI